MKYYQLSSKDQPVLNKYGTLQEIYEHVQSIGWTGKTSIQHGYPLPIGGDISLEESYSKKPNTLRLSHEIWHIIDRIIDQKEEFSNRVDSIVFVMQLYERMESFGPVWVKTPNGVQEFASLKEFIELKPYWEGQGFTEGFELEFKK